MSTSRLARAALVLPKHPVPMRTTFRDCFLVNFAMAPEVLARVLPRPLVPDLHGGEAFVSIVIADLERMRPAFLPARLGVSYRQVVYRAVVRCRGERGVYFLRSDADHPLMVRFGNLFSIFRFRRSAIATARRDRLYHVDLVAEPAEHADIHATFGLDRASRSLPSGSAFGSLGEAQAFLAELFAAFGPGHRRRVGVVRIERGAWDVLTVPSVRATYAFMDGSAAFPANSTRLDSVFYVRDMPYYWHSLAQVHLPTAPTRAWRGLSR